MCSKVQLPASLEGTTCGRSRTAAEKRRSSGGAAAEKWRSSGGEAAEKQRSSGEEVAEQRRSSGGCMAWASAPAAGCYHQPYKNSQLSDFAAPDPRKAPVTSTLCCTLFPDTPSVTKGGYVFWKSDTHPHPPPAMENKLRSHYSTRKGKKL